MNNIYLIGMMGSGKTVTGKQLASLLAKSFLDLDHAIQQRAGITIADIFDQKGEEHFRDLETSLLKDMSHHNDEVISTGGGIVLRPENIEAMLATGRVVYLETKIEGLWDRVKDNTDRPLLKGPNPRARLEAIFKERQAQYKRASNLTVETDEKTAEVVAEEIIRLLEGRE